MSLPLLPLAFAIVTFAGSATFLQAGVVSNNLDAGPGSLRAAISNAVSDEILTFASSLNGATITLTSGQLLISDLKLSIDATSLPSGISISGNNAFRVFGITGASDVTLRRVAIRGGSSVDQNGGGVLMAEGTFRMFDCVVSNCFATYNGGGVFLGFGVVAIFDRCRIVGNTASNLGFGGGIFVGGAAAPMIRNCVIAGNSNPLGGGLSLLNSSPSILNCTIQGNSGGGMYCGTSSAPHIENTLLWGNIHTSGTSAAQQLRSLNNALPVVSYSLVEGASGAASFGAENPVSWGPNNLNGTLAASNPKFSSPINAASSPHAGGDLRLLATSAALNIGNNAAVMGTLDVAGASRVQESIVDLGAYEGGFSRFNTLFPTLDPGGDENNNGVKNLQEYGMGFDPASTLNSTPSPTFSKEGQERLLTINQRSNALDLSISFETSTSLSSWAGLVLGVHYTSVSTTSVNTSRNQRVFRLIANDPKRFYRQGFMLQP